MPAYMKTKQLDITPGNFDLAGTVVPLIALLFIIAIGFAINRAEER